MAVAGREGGLQQGLHLRGTWMVRMVQHHRATAAQQMRTRLMSGMDKLARRRPAIALQHAGVVGAEHPRGLRKTAAVLDRVGGRLGGREDPLNRYVGSW